MPPAFNQENTVTLVKRTKTKTSVMNKLHVNEKNESFHSKHQTSESVVEMLMCIFSFTNESY